MPDRLLLFRREGLATPLLSYRTSGPKAEVDVVEQLRRLIGHTPSLAAWKDATIAEAERG